MLLKPQEPTLVHAARINALFFQKKKTKLRRVAQNFRRAKNARVAILQMFRSDSFRFPQNYWRIKMIHKWFRGNPKDSVPNICRIATRHSIYADGQTFICLHITTGLCAHTVLVVFREMLRHWHQSHLIFSIPSRWAIQVNMFVLNDSSD